MIAFNKTLFGIHIREWRRGEELSQADVAELMGVSPATISGWERGRSGHLLMRNFLTMCEWMERDPRDYFHDPFTHTDNPPPF